MLSMKGTAVRSRLIPSRKLVRAVALPLGCSVVERSLPALIMVQEMLCGLKTPPLCSVLSRLVAASWRACRVPRLTRLLRTIAPGWFDTRPKNPRSWKSSVDFSSLKVVTRKRGTRSVAIGILLDLTETDVRPETRTADISLLGRSLFSRCPFTSCTVNRM